MSEASQARINKNITEILTHMHQPNVNEPTCLTIDHHVQQVKSTQSVEILIPFLCDSPLPNVASLSQPAASKAAAGAPSEQSDSRTEAAAANTPLLLPPERLPREKASSVIMITDHSVIIL